MYSPGPQQRRAQPSCPPSLASYRNSQFLCRQFWQGRGCERLGKCLWLSETLHPRMCAQVGGAVAARAWSPVPRPNPTAAKPQPGIQGPTMCPVLLQALLTDYLEFSYPISQIGKLRAMASKGHTPSCPDVRCFRCYDRKLDRGSLGTVYTGFPNS